jgi:WD40 repeat protein
VSSFSRASPGGRAADFAHSLAVIIGIDRYRNGIPTLSTAANDARALGELLSQRHGYESLVLLDDKATLAGIRNLLTQELPARVGPDDRVFFYFAGHGVALDGDDGPQGFILPQDATQESTKSFLAMPELHQGLCQLPCRHLLAILDCCFAGAFRWSSMRDIVPLPAVLHQERYDRFIRDPAWQVISSAAHDQRALSVLAERTIGVRDVGSSEHSPFAVVLLQALAGAGDIVPGNGGDGVITATELYLYLDMALNQLIGDGGHRQTPRLWPLRKDDKGQYIFLTPGKALTLPPALPLNDANNPYRGLRSYDEEHKDLFFGRNRVARDLEAKVKQSPVTIVLGATGTGKSSVVRAGLLPSLREQGWVISPVVRPGISPLKSSAGAADAIKAAPGDQPIVLVIDQLEELVTMCRDEGEREQFVQWLVSAVEAPPQRLRLVMTLRSDFQLQLTEGPLAKFSALARYVVPPMTQDELRDVIEKPAAERVLYFKPPELVDRLINDVVQTPGGLALLSFTLREMYVRYVRRQGDDRALTMEDYKALGGVVGALRQRATEEYEALDPAQQRTMRRLVLRMVSDEPGDLARRRVPRSELRYSDPMENARVEVVIERLSTARLLTAGSDAENQPYVEPAHDELVRGWDKLWTWIREERGRRDDIEFQRRVTSTAEEWENAGDKRARAGRLFLDQRADLLQRVLTSPDPWLNDTETRFAWESISTKRSRRRLSLGARAAVGLLLGIALVLGGLALANQGTALSRQLAAQALSEMPVRLDRALLLAVQANQVKSTQEARNSLLNVLQYSPHVAAVLQSDRSGKPISAVAITPDGKLAASASANVVTLWDLDRPRRLDGPMSLPNPIWAIAFSPDGKTLAVGSGNRSITFWNPAIRFMMSRLPAGDDSARTMPLYYQKRIAFSPDGKTLAAARGDSTIMLWDVPSHGVHSRSLPVPDSLTYTCVAFSPDGTRLAIGSRWGALLYDLTPGARSRYRVLRQKDEDVITLAFSPDGKRLAASSLNHSTVLWDVETGRPTSTVLPQRGNVSTLAFNVRGDTLLGASYVESISRWELDSGQTLEPLRGHSAVVTDLAISRDGTRMISAGMDGTLVLWNLGPAPALGRVVPGTREFRSLAFSPDSRYLATRNVDSTFTLVDTRRDSVVGVFASGSGARGGIAFSRDGHTLVLSRDASVAAFDLLHPAKAPRLSAMKSGAAAKVIDFDDEESGGTAFSADGNLLAAGTGAVSLWRVVDADSFELDSTIAADASDLAYGRPDNLIAFVDHEGFVSAWDVRRRVASGPRFRLPARQPTSVGGPDILQMHLAFSPDGKLLAGGRGDDGLITFWDPKEMMQKDQPVTLPDGTASLAFDSSGSLLAAGMLDGGVMLIDPVLRQPLGVPLRVAGGDAHALAFSPNGKLLAAGGWNSSVVLWNMESQAWIQRACMVAHDEGGWRWAELMAQTALIDKFLKPASGCPSAFR